VLLRKATSAGYGMAQNSNSIDGVFVWVGGDCHHETHGGLMLLLGSLQCWILLLPHAAVGIDSCAAAPTSVGLFSPARCSRQIGAQEVRPHLKIPEARDDSPRRLRSLASSPTAERRARRRRPLSLLLGRGGDWPAAGHAAPAPPSGPRGWCGRRAVTPSRVSDRRGSPGRARARGTQLAPGESVIKCQYSSARAQ
jgi:hypothetical protein